MIYGNVNNLNKMYYISKKFDPAFNYMTTNFKFTKEKVVDLEYGIKGYFQEYYPKKLDNLNFETHNNFFDIQFVVKGCEFMGIDKRSRLKLIKPYDDDKDISIYKCSQNFGKVLLEKGDFAIVSPDDAHMPGLETLTDKKSVVEKIVFKVPF